MIEVIEVIDVFTGFICLFFGILAGFALTMMSMILYDKRQSDRKKDLVYNQWDWCREHCKIHEEIDSRHKDPDDVWPELEDYCVECPIFAAQEILEKERTDK